MKIALAQINATVGDLAGNAQKIRAAAERAEALGAHVLLTPELALTGYPPEDLLLRGDFFDAVERELAGLSATSTHLAIVIGHPARQQHERFNAASVVRAGKTLGTYHKHLLPNHTVFDEARYFAQGHEALVFEAAGVRCGVNICMDVWGCEAALCSRNAGADLLLVLNASPFHIDKQAARVATVQQRGQETAMPVAYVNLVGGQDELVFDGASFALNRAGEVIAQAPQFEESLCIIEFRNGDLLRGDVAPLAKKHESVYRTLCLGVRDYVEKNGFPGVVLGLSGGIDSALTLAIVADALGPERVHAVMMPSPYTAQISLDDARQLAHNFGVRYTEIAIEPMFAAFRQSLGEAFKGRDEDVTEENLQARIRGNILMALSNKFGDLVVTTGNKSEMAVGYATLYGDMAGGFALLKDVSKTLVYGLSRWRNRMREMIPERVITRAPSAELRPGQTDQDSLPPYAILDAIIEAYVEYDMSPRDIVAAGYDAPTVLRVIRMIDRSEYKRRQAPIGVRVTHRGFGKDRRYPITSHFRPQL